MYIYIIESLNLIKSAWKGMVTGNDLKVRIYDTLNTNNLTDTVESWWKVRDIKQKYPGLPIYQNSESNNNELIQSNMNGSDHYV